VKETWKSVWCSECLILHHDDDDDDDEEEQEEETSTNLTVINSQCSPPDVQLHCH
jgi:hypothetical protein